MLPLTFLSISYGFSVHFIQHFPRTQSILTNFSCTFNPTLGDTSVTSSESASVVSEASEQEPIDDQTSAKLTIGGTSSLYSVSLLLTVFHNRCNIFGHFYRDSPAVFIPITLNFSFLSLSLPFSVPFFKQMVLFIWSFQKPCFCSSFFVTFSCLPISVEGHCLLALIDIKYSCYFHSPFEDSSVTEE